MYPNLSYFFNDIFGTEVDNWTSLFQSFGLFFALAFLGAAYLLTLELKRKEKLNVFPHTEETLTLGAPLKTQDLVTSLLIGFIVGFKLGYAYFHNVDFMNDVPGALLSFKGVAWTGLIGAALFGGSKYYEGKKNTKDKITTKQVKLFPSDKVGEFVTVAAISGLFGAKAFTVIEDWDGFLANPAMFFSGSGLTIYGGLIFGFLGVYWYIRKYNLSKLHFMDAVAPALMAAYSIGRIGCQVSGDGDWGIVNSNPVPNWWFLPDWIWAYDHPHNVSQQGQLMLDCVGKYCHKLPEAVYPTAFYEVILAGLLFGLLWMLRKKVKVTGTLFFLYVFLNGFERFWIEKIRVNIKYNNFGVEYTQAELIAVVLMVIGASGIFILFKKHKKGLNNNI